MTTFNQLVADLKKENLLDDGIFFSSKQIGTAKVPDLPDSIELLNQSNPGLLNMVEKSELKLPDFSFLQTENVTDRIKENPVRAVLPSPPPQVTFHSTQNFIRYQNQRRRRTKSNKKGGKFCRHCELYMPFYLLNCRYCHEKLVGNLYYYSLIMFSSFILVLFVIFILSEKTYR
jgi:hypothetical protein